jgi:hypothetical protein
MNLQFLIDKLLLIKKMIFFIYLWSDINMVDLLMRLKIIIILNLTYIGF